MTCPQCSFDRSNVIRTEGDEHLVKRQRQCCNCGHRWNTTEAKSDDYQALVKLQERMREVVANLPNLRLGG